MYRYFCNYIVPTLRYCIVISSSSILVNESLFNEKILQHNWKVNISFIFAGCLKNNTLIVQNRVTYQTKIFQNYTPEGWMSAKLLQREACLFSMYDLYLI